MDVTKFLESSRAALSSMPTEKMTAADVLDVYMNCGEKGRQLWEQHGRPDGKVFGEMNYGVTADGEELIILEEHRNFIKSAYWKRQYTLDKIPANFLAMYLSCNTCFKSLRNKRLTGETLYRFMVNEDNERAPLAQMWGLDTKQSQVVADTLYETFGDGKRWRPIIFYHNVHRSEFPGICNYTVVGYLHACIHINRFIE